MTAPVNLAGLEPGQTGTVAGFVTDDVATQRLMQLGVVEGADIEFVRRAPAGDPIEVRIMNYALSLRRQEAANVLVDLDVVS